MSLLTPTYQNSSYISDVIIYHERHSSVLLFFKHSICMFKKSIFFFSNNQPKKQKRNKKKKNWAWRTGRDLKKKDWQLLPNGYSCSLRDEKFWSFGHTATWTYLTLLTCVLKNGYDGKFHRMSFLGHHQFFFYYSLRKWGRGGKTPHPVPSYPSVFCRLHTKAAFW